MSTKPLVKTHQVTLFYRALSQTGELDQPMVHPRVVQKYTKYMISKNNKLLHVKLRIKIHVMVFFTLSDPLS